MRDRLGESIHLVTKFCKWVKTKGDFQMNDNELMNTNTEETQAEIYSEALTRNTQPESNEAKSSERKAEAPRRGKPATNGRSEKISLYLTPETFNRLDDLRKYDETTLQDLLNEAIEAYFKTRPEDMKFLQEQTEARLAHKQGQRRQ